MLTKKIKLIFTGSILFLGACQSSQESKTTTGQANTPTTGQDSGFTKIQVQEVLQASEYTYLHGQNGLWLAVPSMQAKVGDTYYYQGGIEMKKFESKELNRVFESIILLEKLNTQPNSASIVANGTTTTNPAVSDASGMGQDGAATSAQYTRKSTPPEKKEIKIAPAAGGITVAKLYADKDAMAGKTVKIKGQVTKYTPAVMGKNWIHIQDGSDFNGKFDLTVTSLSDVKVGDIVTLEGKISLNKDLGYGYFFDVIMEDAVLK